MWKKLLYKWFGLEPEICQTCEVLRLQLDKSERERQELLYKLLARDQPEPLNQDKEEPVPITPRFVPWHVKQQMLEAEDRKKAQLLRDKEKEIADSKRATEINKLEEELGVSDAS